MTKDFLRDTMVATPSTFIDQVNMSMRCVLETIALKYTLSFRLLHENVYIMDYLNFHLIIFPKINCIFYSVTEMGKNNLRDWLEKAVYKFC